MKNKLKLVVAALLICVAAIGVNGTSINYGVRVHNEGIVIDGGESTLGRCDNEYKLAEKYESDAEIYAEIQEAAYSTPIIETMINDGYLLGYVDQLKAEGWIPQDFTPAGSKPSSTAQTETKAEPPADNQAASSETKEQPKTETKTVTKTETKTEPTQEEIDAAWEETERTEATCTEDGKIVYTNSITGDTKEEPLPATGHDYEVTDTAEATCTEDGANTYTCKVCGDTYEEAIPAAGHAEGEWTVTKEAGLFSAGEKTLACEKCGEVLKTESIQQKCPLSLTAVIGIAVCIILVVAIVIMTVAKRRKRQ